MARIAKIEITIKTKKQETMKKIFEKARTWISVRRAESRARQKATARRELERESEKVIQIREFGGEGHVCELC